MKEVYCRVRLNADLSLDLLYTCPVCGEQEVFGVQVRTLLAFEPALAFNNYCCRSPTAPWYLLRVPAPLINKLKGWARAASLSWTKHYPLR